MSNLYNWNDVKGSLRDQFLRAKDGDEFYVPLYNCTVARGRLASRLYNYGYQKNGNFIIRSRIHTGGGYDVRYRSYNKPVTENKTEEKLMTTISDKLTKVNESYTINMYDNGFMVDVGGRDNEDNWANTKIICATIEQVIELVREAASMERHD
jgi:hypothetical protein